MPEHIPVLLTEVLNMLSPQDGNIYFDGTFGGGGYTKAILESANCSVIASDRDPFVQNIAATFSDKYSTRFRFSHSKFSDIKKIINYHNIKYLDGIVLDLGISNFQISEASRGFSFKSNGPIDMSMGLCEETALDIIQKYSENDLANIIYQFGEEHFSRKIAKNIKANINNIVNTYDLAETIRKCVRKTGKTDPATKTFQALRIAVNKELDELKKILDDAVNLLNPNGKIIIVSFHSLEDRIVKSFFKNLSKHTTKFILLNKKPITPSANEIFTNPKSRSAKLRGICMI